MPKNTLQDMVRVKGSRDVYEGGMPTREDIDQRISSYYDNVGSRKNKVNLDYEEGDYRPGGRSGSALWIVAILAVIVLFFALSFLFSYAKITVTPKSQTVALTEKLSASKGAPSGNAIPFNLVVISDQDSAAVPASGQENVSDSAKGKVVIYNSYSSASQALLINTRLMGSNGKIYKTAAAATVPGMKGATPGSVEVPVYASEPGADYNSDPLDFKIMGFQGTPKYDKFYARSDGALAGGQVGTVPSVSDADKAKAETDIENSLKAKLLSEATNQIPKGFVLFNNSAFMTVTSEDLGSVPDGSGQVPLNIKGTLYGFLFDEKQLTDTIANDVIPNYDPSAQTVHIQNISDLGFSLTSKDSDSFNDAKNLSFTISGPAKIVWDVDSSKLASDVLGKKRSDFKSILAGYTNIASADLVIRPIWKFSFPTESKDIKVLVSEPN